MPWFRLEGRGAFHHKVLAAGNEAYGAWCRAGQWCSDQLTDGFVPRAVAEQIAKPKVWGKLVEARLIHEADGGYQIHDYLDWNPSSETERARREEMREKRREAGRAGGLRSGEVRRSKQDGSEGEANSKQSASPDEANEQAKRSSESDPESSSLSSQISDPISADLREEVPAIAHAHSERRANAGGQLGLLGEAPPAPAAKRMRRGAETPIADDWAPEARHFELGAEVGLPADVVRSEAAKFRSDAQAKDKRFVRWGQAFDTWLRNAADYRARDRRAGPRGSSRGPGAPSPSSPAFAPVKAGDPTFLDTLEDR